MRWAAVAAGVVVLGGAGLATTAQAAPELPARTPEQLLVDLQTPTTTTFSGTVHTTADLGLPSLPTGSGADTSDLVGLADGSNTLRVWSDGTDRSRVSLIGDNTETSVIRNGADVWTYRSEDRSATHTTLSDADHQRPSAAPTTPVEAADELLQAVEPSTTVTTTRTSRVAGRDAYELILTPKATEKTLVASATIAIDAETHLPLRVTVTAIGASDPAVEVAFSSIDYAEPDPAVFTFVAPSGTEATENAAPDKASGHASPAPTAPTASPEPAEPTVVGDGWDTVVVGKVDKLPTDEQSAQFLDTLPQVSGSWGSGRALEGTLFSAVLTDDGRVAVGAVPVDQLYAALD